MKTSRTRRRQATPSAAPETVILQACENPVCASPADTPAPLPRPGGKLGTLFDLLSRPEGARIAEMTTATGWQAHSIRGAMSGALKKKLGFKIGAQKAPEGRVYRLTQRAGS